MNDYSEFPPINLFKRALHGAPLAAHIYIKLWALDHVKDKVLFTKEEVKSLFSISIVMFRKFLMHLSRIDLISYKETMTTFQIRFYHD